MIVEDLKFCLKNGISSYTTSINLPEGEELKLLKKLQESCGQSTDTEEKGLVELETKSVSCCLGKRRLDTCFVDTKSNF